jgi:hypothetical protein
MVRRCLVLILIVSFIVLTTASGCQSTSRQLQNGNSEAADETTGPALSRPRESGTGMLLRTGAIQLGPDVGRNQWRWQGDGKGGF